MSVFSSLITRDKASLAEVLDEAGAVYYVRETAEGLTFVIEAYDRPDVVESIRLTYFGEPEFVERVDVMAFGAVDLDEAFFDPADATLEVSSIIEKVLPCLA